VYVYQVKLLPFFSMQYYLSKAIIYMFYLRISAHSLKIETDIKFNTDRCNRLYIKCD